MNEDQNESMNQQPGGDGTQNSDAASNTVSSNNDETRPIDTEAVNRAASQGRYTDGPQENAQGAPSSEPRHFNMGNEAGQSQQNQQGQGQNTNGYYNFRDTNSRTYSGNVPPYSQAPAQRPPKKDHPFLKEIGRFSIKAVIASVIGGLCLVGALAISKEAGIIERPRVSVSAPSGNSGGNGNSLPGNGFYGGRGDFGDDGEDGEENGDANGNGGSADGNNGNASPSDSDGPKLGISVQSVPSELTENGYPEGAMIASIVSGGNADKAGLKVGDIITSFNGSTVKSSDDLVSLVKDVEEGDTVKVVYKRMENSQLVTKDADITFASTDNSSDSNS
ncbi:MAG: PDZ domain-containing protein [Lachnospiraceae bacterium]|nr:PDZ domain-containing protein [Lachnospiraceae bacterium]